MAKTNDITLCARTPVVNPTPDPKSENHSQALPHSHIDGFLDPDQNIPSARAEDLCDGIRRLQS